MAVRYCYFERRGCKSVKHVKKYFDPKRARNARRFLAARTYTKHTQRTRNAF